jgi:hypothetical protein
MYDISVITQFVNRSLLPPRIYKSIISKQEDLSLLIILSESWML